MTNMKSQSVSQSKVAPAMQPGEGQGADAAERMTPPPKQPQSVSTTASDTVEEMTAMMCPQNKYPMMCSESQQPILICPETHCAMIYCPHSTRYFPFTGIPIAKTNGGD